VTLNDRLDYFGQTVNLAARVQSLAHANEIVISNDLAVQPSVGAHPRARGDLDDRAGQGIESDVAVHRLTSLRPATGGRADASLDESDEPPQLVVDTVTGWSQ
jgi:class 3 adenylate cyclase